MSRAEAWFLQIANLAVAGTGLLYAWMLWLAEPADPYAVVNHPWQPQTQAAHVLAAPLLVLAVGMMWRRHAWARIRSGHAPRRSTGLLLAASFWPMAASGWLHQVAVEEAWRNAWSWIHLVTSALWTAAFLTHLLRPEQARIAKP